MADALAVVHGYHRRTKHDFGAYARGPGFLDWQKQPDPFRRYTGAPLLPLIRQAPTPEPSFVSALTEGGASPADLTLASVSQLFHDSLALSAWKQAGTQRWALRVNPSSGNLHPTEGYLVSGPMPGLSAEAFIAHYTPREHALEVRATLPADLWGTLWAPPEDPILLVGLSSVHWREAWKYGERAFRYCQHDVGHALAAVAIAAAGLGWRTRLLAAPGGEDVARLLGLAQPAGVEPESPDCLLAVCPAATARVSLDLSSALGARWDRLEWQGLPNQLSGSHRAWPVIDQVAAATLKPRLPGGTHPSSAAPAGLPPVARPASQARAEPAAPAAGRNEEAGGSLRSLIHRRRSAVAMDGHSTLAREDFYGLLSRLIPRQDRVPFASLWWAPCVHLVLFVHRVTDIEPGLFLLVRNPDHEPALRGAIRSEAPWARPAGCPDELPLYRLASGDYREAARTLSCGQDIAADGCFSLGMLARFRASLAEHGAWFYSCLYWECGCLGQALYLEAEAADMRGTGIGCFFDDPVHALLGLQDDAWQSLYHFTVGGPVEDSRLRTLPGYPEDGDSTWLASCIS